MNEEDFKKLMGEYISNPENFTIHFDPASGTGLAGSSAGTAAKGAASASAGSGGESGGGAPWGAIGMIAGAVGDKINDISNTYYASNAGRADLADLVSGNSWGDVFGNSAKRARGLQTISSLQKDYSGIRNNDNLYNAWNSNDLQDNVHNSSEAGGIAGSIVADTGKLAGVGTMIAPGIGTLIGGAVGLVSGALRGAFSAGQHRKNAAIANAAIDRANAGQTGSYYSTAMANQQNQQRQAMMNYFATGGKLDGLNGIEHFNVGGSHEQNPNGGIQQGIAPDNQPNLVEEGEVKYNDYIYSKRIKPTKSLLKKNNIPEKYHGLSYADIANKLQKESESRPNDPISKSTLDSWMGRLQAAQEETKMINAQRQAAKFIDSLPNEEKMGLMAMMQQQGGQEVPQEAMPQQEPMMMADGGQIYIKPENRGKFTELKERTGHSATWFKEHGTPAQKKMATFALNAKHWDHSKASGGHLFDGVKGNSNLTYSSRPGSGNSYMYIDPEITAFYEQLLGSGLSEEAVEKIMNNYADSESAYAPSGVVDDKRILDKDRISILRQQLGIPYISSSNYTPMLADNQFTTNVSEYVSDPARREYGKFKTFKNAFQGQAVDDKGNYTNAYIQWINGLSNEDIDKLLELSIASPDTNNHESLRAYLNRVKGSRDIYQAFKDLSLDKKYAQQHGFLNSLVLPQRNDYTMIYPNQPVYMDYSGLPVGIGKLREVTPDDKSKFSFAFWNPENKRWEYTLQQEQDKSSKPSKSKEGTTNKPDTTNKLDTKINWDYLPMLGSILTSIQPKDYTYANELTSLASQYYPVAAPSIGGYRRYTPYDINLGDAENIAMEAAALRGNRGFNRATQAGLDAAVINQYQKAQAARNLEWQKANEANRLAVDTYNHGIDKENMALAQAYDQLNANINDKKISLLERAAGARDASDTAWADMMSKNITNIFDNIRDMRKEDWAKQMANEYIKTRPELAHLLMLFGN